MTRKTSYILFLSVIPLVLYSQLSLEVERYPVFFSQHLRCLPMYNPSYIGKDHNFEFCLGNQTVKLDEMINGFSNYFIFNKRLKKINDRSYPFSTLGVLVSNETEGRYLNHGRLYLQYAWHARLNRELFLAAGLKVGGVNYLVRLPGNIAGNSSAYNLDGGTGMSVYTDKLNVGISADQLFNTELKPLNETTKLPSFLNINASRKFELDERFDLIPSALSRITFTGKENVFAIDAMVVWNEKFSFSTGYRSDFGVNFMVGIENLEFGTGLISFGFSYMVPKAESWLNVHAVEFNLLYTIENFKK